MPPCHVEIQRLRFGAIIPAYATDGSAGVDLHACFEDHLCHVILPGEVKLVPTGLKVAFTKDFEMQIRSRSGLGVKSGIVVAQGVGTVDSDYRGEIMVPLRNLSETPFAINPGDRIAQAVFSPVSRAIFSVGTISDHTVRGEGGFGSTGV